MWIASSYILLHGCIMVQCDTNDRIHKASILPYLNMESGDYISSKENTISSAVNIKQAGLWLTHNRLRCKLLDVIKVANTFVR